MQLSTDLPSGGNAAETKCAQYRNWYDEGTTPAAQVHETRESAIRAGERTKRLFETRTEWPETPQEQASTVPNPLTEDKNDFVFRTLSDPANRTEEIVAGLIAKAHVYPHRYENGQIVPHVVTPEQRLNYRKMACKFLWIMKRSKSRWVPTQSCIDLTTLGAALTPEEAQLSLDEVRELWTAEQVRTQKARRVARHFKNCKQCGQRFLAKRANQEFHAKKCGLRWNRANGLTRPDSVMLEPAQAGAGLL